MHNPPSVTIAQSREKLLHDIRGVGGPDGFGTFSGGLCVDVPDEIATAHIATT